MAAATTSSPNLLYLGTGESTGHDVEGVIELAVVVGAAVACVIESHHEKYFVGLHAEELAREHVRIAVLRVVRRKPHLASRLARGDFGGLDDALQHQVQEQSTRHTGWARKRQGRGDGHAHLARFGQRRGANRARFLAGEHERDRPRHGRPYVVRPSRQPGHRFFGDSLERASASRPCTSTTQATRSVGSSTR
jgi:hypothetical protein